MLDDDDQATTAPPRDPQQLIARAVKFVAEIEGQESENRRMAQADLKFSYGDQWPTNVKTDRTLSGRPVLTINRTDTFIRQICNQQRQQRPRIRVHAVGDKATKQTADVIAGIIRHIEVNSAADTAYDVAFESAVRGGWGYFRLVTAYEREDSFDQEIRIVPIENPFSVHHDGFAPDGSDMERCVITDKVRKSTFHQLYPGKDDGSNWVAADSDLKGWVDKTYVRIAEYFYVDRVPDQLLQLSTGDSVWQSDFAKLDDDDKAHMEKLGISVVNGRESFRRIVRWCMLTAMEVLEEKVWPGRFIPIIPMYGNIQIESGKRKKFGVVRFARDPAMASNFWKTAATEYMALAPKPKWLIAAGQDAGFEHEYRRANLSNDPTIHYKLLDAAGRPVPPPSRIQTDPPPNGILELTQMADSDLSAVLGMIDPAMRIGGNVSGKALDSERLQTDNTTFNFYDNLCRSLRWGGILILDLVPKILDAARIMRIIGEDGRPSQVPINTPQTQQVQQPDGTMVAVQKILNDVRVGTYDVTLDTGPGYNTKRQEALDTLNGMMAANKVLGEKIATVAPDLIMRLSDAPYSEQIADRLAAGNPMAQVDELSDVPPAAQMQIKQQAAQIQQLTQAVQTLQGHIKTRVDEKTVSELAETDRVKMKLGQQSEDTQAKIAQADRSDNTWSAEEARQVDVVQMTAKEKMHVDAVVKLATSEVSASLAIILKKLEAIEGEKARDHAADQAEKASNRELAAAAADVSKETT